MNSRKLLIKNLVENTFVAEQGGFSGRSVSDYQTDRGRSRSEFNFTPWDQDPNAIGVSRGGVPRSGRPAPQQVPPQVKVAMDDEEQQQSELGRTIDKFQLGADAGFFGLNFINRSMLGGAGILGKVGMALNTAKWVGPIVSAAVDIAQGTVEGAPKGDYSQFADATARGLAGFGYKVSPAGSRVTSAKLAAQHNRPRPLPTPNLIRGKFPTAVSKPVARDIKAAGGKTINPSWYRISRVGPVAASPALRQFGGELYGDNRGSESQTSGVSPTSDDSVAGYGPDDARVAPSRRPKKKAPPQRQFEFEGRVWDENLAIGLHQQRRKDAMKRAIETGQPFVEPEPPKPVRIPKA